MKYDLEADETKRLVKKSRSKKSYLKRGRGNRTLTNQEYLERDVVLSQYLHEGRQHLYTTSGRPLGRACDQWNWVRSK